MKKVLLLNLMPNKIETENHFKNIFDNLKKTNEKFKVIKIWPKIQMVNL